MNQENFTEAMLNAETAFANHNFETALDWYKKALEENPNDPVALSNAGASCMIMRKLDDGLGYFKKIQELDPKNGDNAYNIGSAYLASGNLGKALDSLCEAEMLGVSDNVKPKLYYQLAVICAERGDMNSALVNFKKFEEADINGQRTLDPQYLAQRLRVYLALKDYENAEKYALKWIGIDPKTMNPYIVLHSVYAITGDYDRAVKTLDDALEYADLKDEDKLVIGIDKAAVLVSKADSEPTEAANILAQADALLLSLSDKAEGVKKKEIDLMRAELLVKQGKLDDAIGLAERLDTGDIVREYKVESVKSNGSDMLDEAELDAMAEEDIAAIDAKIAAGELDDSIGEYAEVYYDDNGNPVRQYPEGIFDTAAAENDTDTAEKSVKKTGGKKQIRDFADRLYFTLLTCYINTDKYKKSVETAAKLMNSSNSSYSDFAAYAEAYSMRKTGAPDYAADVVEKKYNEVIARLRSRMIKEPGNLNAAVLRSRMYAEIGKFAKAEEIINLLSPSDKKKAEEYINQCRKGSSE